MARFKGLSALATLKDDEDNLAQLTRRAKSDADLLQQVLRVYGYYDPGITQTIERPANDTPTGTTAAASGATPAKAEPPKRRGSAARRAWPSRSFGSTSSPARNTGLPTSPWAT
ncbi:hypothetical protein ACFS32_18155 [Novosphingobium pokkalii]|uniref:hypothetical protein n=1 Tax=Novosphingobium pokkalii TaxID=1770194 RepID=UPI0036288D0F